MSDEVLYRLPAYEELRAYLGTKGIRCLFWCLQDRPETFGGDNNAYDFVNLLEELHNITRNEAWEQVLNIARKLHG